MALALQREPTAYRSLLTRAGAVLADPEPMLSRLVRGCIALAFTAYVLAVACSHRLLDTIKGGQQNYMTPAMQREQSTYRPLLTRARAVLTDTESMLSRLVRGCITLAFIACVHAVACSHRFANTIKGGQQNYMTPAMQREQSKYRSLLTRVRAVLANPETMLSVLVWYARRVHHPGLHCLHTRCCMQPPPRADAVQGGKLSYM